MTGIFLFLNPNCISLSVPLTSTSPSILLQRILVKSLCMLLLTVIPHVLLKILLSPSFVQTCYYPSLPMGIFSSVNTLLKVYVNHSRSSPHPPLPLQYIHEKLARYCRTPNVSVCLYIAYIARRSASLYIKTLYFFLTVLVLSAAATVANIKIRYDGKTPQFTIFWTRGIYVFYSISSTPTACPSFFYVVSHTSF